LCRDCDHLGRLHDRPAPERCPLCHSRRILIHAELPTLSIAHIDCDAFYASVEKRDRPELRTRPLIVGHPGGRGVVTTACYIARRFGVHSAMPMFKAREACPQAVIIPPDMAKYRTVSAAVREIFASATAMIEPVSLDEAYLDLSTPHLHNAATPAQALTTIARRIEKEIRITVSVGLAANKFLAKLASDLDKPRGFSVIGMQEAVSFLAPLPVTKINGVGAVTARQLERAGIHTIGQLQHRTEQELEARFGRFGRRLAGFAHARDERAVTPHRAAKSVSAETTFRSNISDCQELCDVAQRLCDRLAGQLSRKRIAGSTIVLKLKTHDFRLLTRSRQLPAPTQRSEVLIEHIRPLIEREADGRAFRLIGVGLDRLVAAKEADPPDLFS
jgi:DNA polymerase-4